MDGHADIPPSYTGLSQYLTTPFGDGGDESFNGASTPPPPRGSSLAPLPQCLQFPPTNQPSQYGSQNFIPGPNPSWPSSSVFSLQPYFQDYPSATVANNDMALPPIPYMMPNSSSFSAGSGLPPSDNMISRLNSVLAQNNQRIYPKPIEMPVGVRSQNESPREYPWSHHEDVNVDVYGNKRRAGNEIAPPSRIWRRVSADTSLNEKSTEPSPNPQGVSVDVGNDSAYGGMFTPYQLSKIAACADLKVKAASDPKGLKRRLSNREAAARSRERKLQYQSELEVKVEILETRIDTLTAQLKLAKRERMAAADECVQLKIRLNGGEEYAPLREALIEQLSGEVRRLTEEARREREAARREREDASGQREEISRLREEVSEYRRRESERMNANMLEQLNMNQQFQEKPQQTNYNFE